MTALLLIVLRRREAIIAGLAAEKAYILKDLHDGIGGITTNIGLIADMASRSDDAERQRRAVSDIAQLSQDGMAELRGVMDSLDPEELSWTRLVSQLRHLGRQTCERTTSRSDFRATSILQRQRSPR